MPEETMMVTPFFTEGSFATFGEDAIEFIDFEGKKQRFEADGTKGFFQFALAHAWPKGQTVFGTGLHPAVTAMSWRSILYQPMNYEHRMNAYHKGEGNPVDDRILGSVVAASYPVTPSLGWKVNDGDTVPSINGVASFAKLATAMGKVVGEHETGRHKYTVSMEVIYDFNKSGFLVQGKGLNSGTPDDIAKMGFDYVPVSEANDELVATFSRKKNRIVKQYKGKNTSILMGGVNTPVHFAGVGLVKYGAEPTAKIQRLAASADPAEQLLGSVEDLAELLKQAVS